MKKSRFTEEQMVAILREANRSSVAEVAWKYKVSEQNVYNWRTHFGGLAPADVKRPTSLETENARLKKLLAEHDLDIRSSEGHQPPKVVSPQARREQIAFACERGLSKRRAWRAKTLSRRGTESFPQLQGD